MICKHTWMSMRQHLAITRSSPGSSIRTSSETIRRHHFIYWGRIGIPDRRPYWSRIDLRSLWTQPWYTIKTCNVWWRAIWYQMLLKHCAERSDCIRRGCRGGGRICDFQRISLRSVWFAVADCSGVTDVHERKTDLSECWIDRHWVCSFDTQPITRQLRPVCKQWNGLSKDFDIQGKPWISGIPEGLRFSGQQS